MNPKKATAIGLYLKDLRRSDLGNVYDYKTAAIKFKSLSVRDKDYYEVAAKKINEKKATEVVFTTQRDTLGNNLKEVSERSARRQEWENKCRSTIISIASSVDVLDKEFFAMKISGVDFSRSDSNKHCYATSEICLLKFSFNKGIIDELVLFPDIVNVAAGYRQHLYEDLEENVGWKPETFRNNHTIHNSICEIRKFFNGKYEPIYIPTKDHVDEVGLALIALYDENQMSCPWIESYDDWGKHCILYQLEYLVSAILADDPNQKLSVSAVLDFWRKLKFEIAPDTCERHLQYGLANQCARNMLIKYVYGSFLMLQKPGSPDIQTLVSREFYQDLDFITPMDASEDFELNQDSARSHPSWNNYFESDGVEDIITSMTGVTIRGDANSVASVKRPVEFGRGRGLARQQEKAYSIPGVASGVRKLKLPKVVC